MIVDLMIFFSFYKSYVPVSTSDDQPRQDYYYKTKPFENKNLQRCQKIICNHLK